MTDKTTSANDLVERVRDTVGDMASGAVLVARGPGMDLELVKPIPQPGGDVIDQLMHCGWLEGLANGGGYRLSDAGKLAYLRSTDELGDERLVPPHDWQN